ncbi:hypothetical protein [Brevundimonas vesicularis]|uniref:hypothetical protein n=1 Tax=Brevundimonas vesicularis TaxID=41276 RepID=UPI0022AC0CF6|nr:hypothetical protein [Brevundimonas vesicularis]
MRTALWAAVTMLVLEIIKWLFGVGVSLTIAVAAMSFCIGALWVAGKKSDADGKREG